MSNRLWIFGAVLASIAIVVLGWVVGISPKLAEGDAAATQRQNVDSQNLAQEQANVLLKEQFSKIKTYQDELKKLQVSVPASAALDVFSDQIVTDAAANGLILTNLTSLEAAVYGGSVDPTAATNPDTVKPEESTAADPNAPAAGLNPSLTNRFFTIGVSLKVTGGADQIFTFAKGLQGDKRLFLVTDIQFTTDGEPGATITGFIFVVADPPAAAQ
ncbi:MAG: hypothetical protein IT189_10300 [Microbacteriaceae bacterium]|nr:hypothetical protein [Microbacteriaceae bacterium]